MANPNAIITADGSHTLVSAELGECYHSVNGALQESLHVFIDAGFCAVKKRSIRILEVGFGTGLNALLSLIKAEKNGCSVYYESVELYPITMEVAEKLNYPEQLGQDKATYFLPIHSCEWGKEQRITPFFTLKKIKADISTCKFVHSEFDLVYFDAFAPDVQPELWSAEVFSAIYAGMLSGAMLVTYSAKGLVKQHLREAGFTVRRLAGAAGKRHMLQAIKN